MPDQTVTDDRTLDDDVLRALHEWAAGRRKWEREGGELSRFIAPIVEAIETYVPHPAPPATLADELRKFAYKTIGADGYPLDDGDKELLDIADRAEAVEKANRDTERELLRAWAERDAAYSENNRVCAALATVTDERNNAWDRLADLQDVREELHAARAEVELLAAQIDRMVETYASEVERLTRERDEARGGRDAINKALSAAATRTAEALCERDEARGGRDAINKALSAAATRTAEALCERDEAREKLADKLDEVAQLHTEVERLTGESAARFDHIEVLEKRVERMVATGSTYPSDALPDLPEPIGEIAAQRYGGNPDARWIGYYDDSGERTVAGLIDAYPGEVDTPEGVLLTPDLTRQYALALLAAADYAERNQE